MLIEIVIATLSAASIFAILHDVFEVMLLPRRVKSKMRIVRYFFWCTWAVWSAIGRRIRSEDKRHSFLGLYGPMSLVLLLLVWASALIFSFGNVFWSLSSASLSFEDWLNQIYFSGATFFTLGYGDFVPHVSWAKALSVLESGTGLGFIALVIGYLPVMYQLFSRREAQVIMLDSVAGSPPTAATILFRYADGRCLDCLDGFLLQWQQWAAELLESQLSYPMLSYYRSQHDNQSWLAALTVSMDTSVLIMSGLDGVHTFQARLTFATARLAVIEMGRVLGVGPAVSDHDRLDPEAFSDLKARLASGGLTFVDEDETFERLKAFRDTYETFLQGLADHLLVSLPPWSADPGRLDNWVYNPRGRSAKRLFDSVAAEPEIEGESNSVRARQSRGRSEEKADL